MLHNFVATLIRFSALPVCYAFKALNDLESWFIYLHQISQLLDFTQLLPTTYWKPRIKLFPRFGP